MLNDHRHVFGGMVCEGRVCPEFQTRVKAMQLETRFSVLGNVRPDLAMKYAVNAGVLLLLEADMGKSPFLPSKCADYAATGRPILAITPLESAIRDVLAGASRAQCVQHDSEQLIAALCQLFRYGNPDAGISDDALPSEFSSATVVDKYTEMFNVVSSLKKRSARCSRRFY